MGETHKIIIKQKYIYHSEATLLTTLFNGNNVKPLQMEKNKSMPMAIVQTHESSRNKNDMNVSAVPLTSTLFTTGYGLGNAHV